MLRKEIKSDAVPPPPPPPAHQPFQAWRAIDYGMLTAPPPPPLKKSAYATDYTLKGLSDYINVRMEGGGGGSDFKNNDK